ncbi:MAG: TVP38/TMEM64 family protein [Leptolyngbyaceae cyanobacterium bins.59]|nr:TVP38/TMEM64 family protein [Leptolyngbyaceae cyanobacterium bins.59]
MNWKAFGKVVLVLYSCVSLGAIVLPFATPTLADPITSAAGFAPQVWLQTGLQWIDSLGATGGLVFVGLYVLATITFIPGTVLTLGAGVLFGVVLGSVYVFVGATLGAIAAFLIGRYLVRDRVSQTIANHGKFKAIDKAIAREGFKIVLLTRLSPLFPFNLLNYALGVTGVTLKDYALACVGMIPGTVMYVYIGSLAGDLARLGARNQAANPTAQMALNTVGFVATVVVTLYITRIARKALSETVES